MHSKVSSPKRQPFCLGLLNVLNQHWFGSSLLVEEAPADSIEVPSIIINDVITISGSGKDIRSMFLPDLWAQSLNLV